MPHHELKQLPDGKIEVKLETGETFTGDPLEVTAKLADSKVETRRHYEAKEAELLARNTSTENETSSVNQTATQVNSQEQQWQTYILEQTAKGLGYPNGEAYKADLIAVRNKTAEFENHAIAATFLGAHPDFPNTPEANDKITKFLSENRIPVTPTTLEMAHTKLVQEGAYKPLSEEEITASWSGRMNAANRPTPAPMLRGGNPETSQAATFDPWSKDVSLDQLRKAALAEQHK